MIGRVVSIKMEKTAVVLVESPKTHPVYKKAFVRTKKYLAHDELGVKDGDIVDIIKCKPVSKRKHWMVVKVVGRDIVAIVEEELKEEAKEAIAEVLPEDKEVQKPEEENVSEVSKVSKETKRGRKKS